MQLPSAVSRVQSACVHAAKHRAPEIAAPLHVSQNSALLPNTLARISAVAAVTLRLLLQGSLTCLRCTPIASASAVCVRPIGYMNSSTTILPGLAGLRFVISMDLHLGARRIFL